MNLTCAVVIEQTRNNYVACVPEVPGCISTARTWDEMLAMLREALTVHIEFLIEDDDPIPEPITPSRTTAKSSPRPTVVPAEHGDAPLTVSTTFRMVEIEVPVSQL